MQLSNPTPTDRKVLVSHGLWYTNTSSKYLGLGDHYIPLKRQYSKGESILLFHGFSDMPVVSSTHYLKKDTVSEKAF